MSSHTVGGINALLIKSSVGNAWELGASTSYLDLFIYLRVR